MKTRDVVDGKVYTMTETKTVTTTNSTGSSDKPTSWCDYVPQSLKCCASSDVPVLIIFACVAIITLSFVLEQFVE